MPPRARKPKAAKPPIVYLDACVYLKVIKGNEEYTDACTAVFDAFERGEIEIATSTVVLMELNGCKGDVPPADRDKKVAQYLTETDRVVHWAELDYLRAMRVRDFASTYGLRGPDAAHLALAIRLNAKYLFTFDERFPLGKTVDDVIKVCRPHQIWEPSILDAQLEWPAPG